MDRYGIEDVGNAVKESTICPFMLERECSTLAENDCVRCVKGWFAEHDKQIRDEVVDEIIHKLFEYAKETQSSQITLDLCKLFLKQMKGEQNERDKH